MRNNLKKIGLGMQILFMGSGLLVVLLASFGFFYKQFQKSEAAVGGGDGISLPVKQFIMYQPPRWASSGVLLTNAEVAQRFGSLSYSHNGLAGNLVNYTSAGFVGDSTVYLIMDTIMGPSGLSSLTAQRTKCTSTQKLKSVNSNNAAMDVGDFCEIHDAIVTQSALPDYPDIFPTENWFLHNSDGVRLESVAGPDATYKTNPGDRNWQEYYARRALRELAPVEPNYTPISGVDGLFIDNVQLNWGLILKSTNNQPPKEYSTDSSYAQAVVDFLKTVHTKLHTSPYNFPVWGNITPVTASRSWGSVAPYLEGAMQEIFLLSYSGGMPWGTGPADITTSLEVLDRTENWIKSGKHFVAIAQGNTSGDYNKYIFSLVLLVTDGQHVSYKYRAVNSSNYYEIPEFYAKLGNPTNDRQQISTNPVVFKRNFECGSVQVDLTNHTASIQETANCLVATPTAVSVTNTPTPQPATAVCPQSMLSNPCFESGTTGWSFNQGNADATFAVTAYTPYGNTGKSGQITINQTGSNPQLYKYGFNLTSGKKYKLTFAARSNTGHNFGVHILKHTTPFTMYASFEPDLTTYWQTFTYEFTPSVLSETTSDTRFRFWTDPYDVNGDQYFIDNVSLTEVVDEVLPTLSPTNTPTSQPESGTTLKALMDAYVDESAPDTNYNTGVLASRHYKKQIAYLKFDLSAVANVTKAVLRLRVFDPSANAHYVKETPIEWGEATITYNTRKIPGVTLASFTPITTGWREIDLTSYINSKKGVSRVSLAVETTNSDNLQFYSSETSYSPELVITY